MADRSALVLGATGGIGGDVARRLKTRGWTVRALYRDPSRVGGPDGLIWVRGDALVASACRNNARVLLPGTIYNYGPFAFPHLNEGSVQQPVSRKGRIRVEMEARLRRVATQGAMALIVRAGDDFGPGAGNNWFSHAFVTPGRPVTAITFPGRPGVGHQWAYLPDVAETMVRLVEHPDLDAFATFHMPLAEAVRATLMGLGCLRRNGKPAQNASGAMGSQRRL